MKIKEVIMRETVEIKPLPGANAVIDNGKQVATTADPAALAAIKDGKVNFSDGSQTTPTAEAHETPDSILTQIAQSGDFDALYDLHGDYLNSRVSPARQAAAKKVNDMYDDISSEHGHHPDDDFEQIYGTILDQLEADFGGEEQGGEDRYNAQGDIDPNGAHDAAGHYDAEQDADRADYEHDPMGEEMLGGPATISREKGDDFVSDVADEKDELAEMMRLVRR